MKGFYGWFFSVSSLFSVLAKSCSSISPVRCLWHIKAPLRLFTFGWIAILDKLLSQDNLHRHGRIIVNAAICVWKLLSQWIIYFWDARRPCSFQILFLIFLHVGSSLLVSFCFSGLCRRFLLWLPIGLFGRSRTLGALIVRYPRHRIWCIRIKFWWPLGSHASPRFGTSPSRWFWGVAITRGLWIYKLWLIGCSNVASCATLFW